MRKVQSRSSCRCNSKLHRAYLKGLYCGSKDEETLPHIHRCYTFGGIQCSVVLRTTMLFYSYFNFSSPDDSSLSCHPSKSLFFSVPVIAHLFKFKCCFDLKNSTQFHFSLCKDTPFVIMKSSLF